MVGRCRRVRAPVETLLSGQPVHEPGVAAAQPGNLRSDIGPEIFHLDPEARENVGQKLAGRPIDAIRNEQMIAPGHESREG